MKKNILITGGIAFILFTVFTLLVRQDYFMKIDYDATVRIQNNIPKFMDTPFSFFSLLGSFELTTVLLFLGIIFSRKWSNLIFMIAWGIGHIIEIIGKTTLSHPGPPFQFFRYDLDFIFPSSHVQTQASYPSGHTYRTIFLVALLLAVIFRNKRLNRHIRAVCYILLGLLSVVTIISRVSLGEHWMSDVIGGVLLALSASLIPLAMTPLFSRGRIRRMKIVQILQNQIKQ